MHLSTSSTTTVTGLDQSIYDEYFLTHQNRDAILTSCVNSLTSFYSGFVIFTYLGYMAAKMDKDIENVASEGYGLVFMVSLVTFNMIISFITYFIGVP